MWTVEASMLTLEERAESARRLRAQTTTHRDRQRAEVVLLAADGVSGALRQPAGTGEPSHRRGGHGFQVLLDGLKPERILLASEALGIGRASIDKAVAYGKNRIVFDRPIGQNQGIASPLAKAHMRLHAAELALREAS